MEPLDLSDDAIISWYRTWFENNYGQACGRVNPSTIAAIRDAIKRFCPSASKQTSDACSICDI